MERFQLAGLSRDIVRRRLLDISVMTITVQNVGRSPDATDCAIEIFMHRQGTNGDAANYELRVGMHTISLRPQQASLRALGPFFCDRGARRWMVPKFQ